MYLNTTMQGQRLFQLVIHAMLLVLLPFYFGAGVKSIGRIDAFDIFITILLIIVSLSLGGSVWLNLQALLSQRFTFKVPRPSIIQLALFPVCIMMTILANSIEIRFDDHLYALDLEARFSPDWLWLPESIVRYDWLGITSNKGIYLFLFEILGVMLFAGIYLSGLFATQGNEFSFPLNRKLIIAQSLTGTILLFIAITNSIIYWRYTIDFAQQSLVDPETFNTVNIGRQFFDTVHVIVLISYSTWILIDSFRLWSTPKPLVTQTPALRFTSPISKQS
jgi:hypothetical protein